MKQRMGGMRKEGGVKGERGGMGFVGQHEED